MSALRVMVVGKHQQEVISQLDRFGLELDESHPEVVISYGGDGTLLGAERAWPGVPKVALRDSQRCRTCSHESNEVILRHLAEGRLKRTEFMKLEASARGRRLVCLNNVIVHNAIITSGVRYRVWIDDESYGDREIVGDGLVVSTPFGSAAYYRSITHSTIRVGIGLAFNNSIEPINHLVLAESSLIRIRITRGPATLTGDQAPDKIEVDRGDEILICRSEHAATILVYDRVQYPADQFIFFPHDK